MHSLHSATACGGIGAITPLAGVGAGPTTDGTGDGAAGIAAGTVDGMPAGEAGTVAGDGPITTIRTTIRVGIIRDPVTGLRATRILHAALMARVTCLHHPEYLRVLLQFVAVRLLVLQQVSVLHSRPDVQPVLLPDVW